MAVNFTDQPVQVYDSTDTLINPAKEDGHLATIDTSTATTATNTGTIAGAVTASVMQENLKQVGGTAVDVNTGNATAGTQRVVLATNQPAIAVTSTPAFATRSDTYTTTSSGTTVDTHTSPLTSFAIQVKGTGASATSWNVVLEGSLDNAEFTTILTHKTNTGDGACMWSGSVLSPVLYFRSRVTALTLGPATNIVVTILGQH
jgi:hypothetical protein